MANDGGKEPGLKSVIDNLSSTVVDALGRAEGQIGAFTGKRTFPVDVIEYGDSYVVEASVPGVPKEKIDISVEGGKLTISVNPDQPQDQPEGGSYRYRERWCGSATRTIDLADASDAEGVQAILRDGVLKLRVQKSAKKQAKKVNID